MTATLTTSIDRSTTTRSTSVLRVGALATVLASAATELYTAVLRSAGVHLAVGNIGGTSADVVKIGPGACTIMVTICVAAGLLVAGLINRYAQRPARTFGVVALGLTVASFVPDVFAGATATSSKISLMGAHVIAAAIVIPLVSRRLRRSS